MARVNGHAPGAPQEEDTRPPRLPWVLVCHHSGGACGTTWTVNRFTQWREMIKSRQVHESLCTVRPVVAITGPGDLLA